MHTSLPLSLRSVVIGALLLPLALLLPPPALSGPGAHGPNGEHLDAPSQVASVGSRPRLEAATDAFELVATLYADKLSILIDRFATNEPVLQAKLSVESGGIKAEARFHEDHGDFTIEDPKLLALLQKPGEHALVFTLVAGEESDLLDALLRVAGDGAGSAHDDGHSHALERVAVALGGLALLGGGLWFWRRRAAAKGGL
jgi:hypothetical protein